MATVDQLTEYIRFQLDELGAKNAHHEFEHLCRHLTRQRICSNVLPATGPVAAGGDQGRDFETFRTYLRSSPLATSAFVGLASDRPLAFACSLQRDIMPKIRADVGTIAEAGQPVEAVHYFCTANVPVARRHDLQTWAREHHAFDLEVYDGPAIAEMLSDRDVFWIASRYLGVPSELYPLPTSGPDEPWYVETMAAWQAHPKPSPTYAAFAMVKAAVRHTTSTPERINELQHWLKALEQFMTVEAAEPLRFRAIYEVAVASLRGMGTMEGNEERLRSYFTAVPSFTFISDLEDASCLATFAHEALHRHGLGVALSEVVAWIQTVVVEVDRQLVAAGTSGSRAQLLELRGYVEMARALGIERTPSSLDDTLAVMVDYWTQAAEAAEAAPLFPLERFADRLTQLAWMIGDEPGYEPLTRRVDALLADRVGDRAVANLARRRALTFYTNGRVLRAVSELHEAKVRWYANETLQGSALAMLFIARCYDDLGLTYASKYYALAAAQVASGSDDPNVRQLLPRALSFAAECDYVEGNWRAYFRLMRLAMATHWHFAHDPDDFDANPDLERRWLHGTTAVAISERIDPGVGEAFHRELVTWAGADWAEEFMSVVRPHWSGLDVEQVQQAVETELRGPALGDLALEREVTWAELGITWRIRWMNVDSISRSVEQFIAVLQIALTDFAEHDLHLLRTDVDIEAEVGDVAQPQIIPLPSNDGRQWKITLPSHAAGHGEAMMDRIRDVFGAVSAILREASLLSDERFFTVVETVVRGGVAAKLLVARSYERLAAEFADDTNDLLSGHILGTLVLGRRVNLPAHPELEWIDGLIPAYSSQEAADAVQRRYAHGQEKLPLSIARLRESAEFQAVVSALRQDGWRDWHILLAVANQTWNYRTVRAIGPLGLIDPDNDAWRRYAFQPENARSPEVPLSEYTADKLRDALVMTRVSTLAGWGLECHQRTPDLPAIDEFLSRRCNYWIDDVEHDDLWGLGPLRP